MSVHHFNEIFIQILILLTLSVAVTMISNHFKQPYSIALVLIGLVVGMIEIPALEGAKDFITQSNVFQIAIISIFLPILLGEATLKLPFHHLYENKKPILSLALCGTLLSFIIIGFSTYYILDLPIAVAFVFAALMSATDPISVLSIFKSLGVNERINATMEGESLFNDGIAIVLFKISSVYLLTYMNMGIGGFGEAFLLFLKFAVGGLLIGTIFGLLGSFAIKPIDDYPLEIAISILVFFGSFFVGEIFHVSGVIAVVTAGLIFGNYGRKIGMSDKTKLTIDSFWDSIAFIANSLIFLMIGLEISRIDFEGKWIMILVGILIVLLGRSIAVYVSLFFNKEIPSNWKHLFNYGGLKGSLSIALALSLPHSFNGRDDILVLSFSVVLFSLIIQGLTIKPLVKKLKIT